MSEILTENSDAVLAGNIGTMDDLTEDAFDDGLSPQ